MSNRTSACAPVNPSSRYASSRYASTFRGSVPDRLCKHTAFLAGVSVAALLAASAPAHARALNGGRSVAQPVTAATDAAAIGAQQAAAVARRSMDSLTRATQAMTAMRDAQAAARNAAAAATANVPNGLAGLVPDPRAMAGTPNLWVNASTPTETKNGDQTTVTIQQQASRAVLTWQRFDVGAQTTLVYDQQGNRDWIALNRIDATGVPSRIAGQIKADGTVLIINPNGIVFTGTSQVNVNSLIVSTNDITSSAFASVFAANNPNYVQPSGQTFFVPAREDAANTFFLENGLFTLDGANGGRGKSVAFGLGNTRPGLASDNLPMLANLTIDVQAGARINANVSDSNDGGYVALIGPKVSNAGAISTSKGAIHLLAGANAVLTEPLTTDTGHKANISGSLFLPSLAGLPLDNGLSPFTAAPTINGVVTNDVNGLLISRTGAVNMVGHTLNQLGGIDVTTGVSRPGSISLYGDFGPDKSNFALGSGQITIGARSVLLIAPEDDGATIPTGAANQANYFQSNLQPKILISSPTIVIPDGAIIKAPAASLNLAALGSVVLEPGSMIDLSGRTSAVLPMSRNFLSILVTQNEIADSPGASALIGKTVIVDARLRGTRADGSTWVGSPIVNAAGYADAIPMSIDELLSAAGSVSFSGQSFVQRPGAIVNVSGGYVTYTGGETTTTQLLGSNGRYYSIGNADPSLSYVVAQGFTVNHERWGIAEIYTSIFSRSGSYEQGYIAGRSAGRVDVNAVNPILQGTFVAETVTGRRQRMFARGGRGSAQENPDDLPSGATLNIQFASRRATDLEEYTVALRGGQADADSYDLAHFDPDDAAWLPQLRDKVFPIFTDALNAVGFGAISISGAYDLRVDTGAKLSVRPGGSITLKNVSTVNGELRAPGGTISLEGFVPLVAGVYLVTQPQTEYQLPPVPSLVVGPNAVLDVSGRWVNDKSVELQDIGGPAFIDGGSISITTQRISQIVDATAVTSTGQPILVVKDVTQGIVLAPGSILDVSSGGYVDARGRIKQGADGLPVGRGGNITLASPYADGAGSQWQPLSTAVAATDLRVTNSAGTIVYGTIVAGSTYTLSADLNAARDVNHYFPTSILGAEYLPDHGGIVIGGTIYAGGLSSGGTFSLQAPTIRVADGPAMVAGYGHAAVNDALAAQLATRFGLSVGTTAGWLNAGGAAGSATAPGTVALAPSFFAAGGFSSYSLRSSYGGLTIAADTTIRPTQGNYIVGADALDRPTGTPMRSFSQFGLLPVGQRGPVNLALSVDMYGYDTKSSPRGFLLDKGARIVTDPQASVTIASQGLTRILGDIVAPAGDVSLIATNYPMLSVMTNGSLWIGDQAVLDVSGVVMADPSPIRSNRVEVLDAGTITLAAPTTVVRDGASLLLRGAFSPIDRSATSIFARGTRLQPIWSRGGNLQLATVGPTNSGSIYFAGMVDASGGAAQAMGGSMTLGKAAISAALATQARLATQLLEGPNNIFIEPEHVNVAAGLGDAPVGTADIVTPVQDTAFISSKVIDGSKFDSVVLYGGNIGFVGSVRVNMPGALTLQASKGSIVLLPSAQPGSLLPAGMPNDPRDYNGAVDGTSVVQIDAGYLRLVGGDLQMIRIPSVRAGSFTASAKWIDLQRHLSIGNASDVSLVSASAIRALPDNYGFELLDASARTTFGGALYVPGNLTLAAAEVFPATNTHFLIESVGSIAGANTLTIQQNGAATAPLSAGGGLYLDAVNIIQNGTVWAPLGTVVLGLTDASQIPAAISTRATSNVPVTPTRSVILGAGSLTSVSAYGLTVPYGQTIDGTAWYAGMYQNTTGVATTTPPLKQIGFNTANIDQRAGAVIDISGGGEIYATEFVPGTGGSRNVLTTYQVSPSAVGVALTPQYPDERQVYALVPSQSAPVAPYDSTFAGYPYFSGQSVAGTRGGNRELAGIAPGTAVYLDGGNGIPAGMYTLMPGMYATLPGAYRVVQISGNGTSGPLSNFPAQADGSLLISGRFANALTGGRDGLTSVFQLQSADVWSKYSRIDISRGSDFFTRLALKSGDVVPRLPIDGGLASFGASASLNLGGTFLAGPAPGGRGGVIAISSENILVKSSAQATPTSAAGYLLLDADQISRSGASQVVIGGAVSYAAGGEVIEARTGHVEVLTDAAHPLAGNSVVLVSRAGGLGITLDPGSVLASIGSGDTVDTTPIIATSVNGNLGSLLRISAGGPVGISRSFTPAADPSTTAGSIVFGSAPGTMTPHDGSVVSILASSLSLDTSGSLSIAGNTDFRVSDIDISGPIVSLGNVGGLTGGVRVSSADIARFAGAHSLRLRSATVFNVYDAGGAIIGDTLNRIAALTFDGAGFYHQGGQAIIRAQNIALVNSLNSSSTSGALNGTGGAISFEATGLVSAGTGKKTFAGFAQLGLTGAGGIEFVGDGGFEIGSANAALNAHGLVVRGGADQFLTTTGAIAIGSLPGDRPAVAAADFGGSLTLTGTGIVDNSTIIAHSGKVKLSATSGGVVLGDGALIDATGATVTVVDRVTYAPGGAVHLAANGGNIVVSSGALVDVSAAGLGYAGSLIIETGESGVVTLAGQTRGDAAFSDLGGSLRINTGALAGDLPWSRFTGGFDVSVAQGDLRIASGTTLTSGFVQLTANNGNVVVDGTIDARMPGGGTIRLFGAGTAGPGGTRTGGVSINAGAHLDASHRGDDPDNPRYASTSTQIPNGGTITLGTTGTPNGTYNSNYGNQNVDRSGSGRIYVDAGATLEVSPGTNGTGGQILVRAPVLTDNGVNVDFRGRVVGASAVALSAYATWSTTDDAGQTGATKHFDGIIDPAGWYTANGAMVNGTWASMVAYRTTAANSIVGAGGFTGQPVSVILTGGGGSGATATAVMNVDNVQLTNSGVYTSQSDAQRPTVTFARGAGDTTGVGATGKALLGINTITVLDGGSGYDPNIPVQVTVPAGDVYAGAQQRDAVGTAIVNANGQIVGVNFTNRGVGMFVNGAVITVTAPTTGTSARFQVDTVRVVGVQIAESVAGCCNRGVNYTRAPVVTFSGGAGPGGAQGTGLLQISALNITSSGSGYTSAPTGFTATRPDGSTFSGNATFQLLAGGATGTQVNGVITSTAPTSGGSVQIVLVGSGIFTPTAGQINTDHKTFYDTTLKNFVANSFAGNTSQVKSDSFSSIDPSLLHLRPEVALVNPDANRNGGNITVASNWNLGAGTVTDAVNMRADLFYRTSVAKEPGTLTLRAVNDVQINATLSDGFFTTAANGASLTANLAANNIANNPAVATQPNTTSIANLMPPTIASAGSFSYVFVAGATGLGNSSTAPAANPDAVATFGSTGDVTIDRHTVFRETTVSTNVIYMPSMLRTGTGSIRLTAGGDIKWLDALAPGAIYTGGRALSAAEMPSAADFTRPVQTATNPPGLATQPTWAVGGGPVDLSAGGSIIGIERSMRDANLGQLWNGWYFRRGLSNGSTTPFPTASFAQTATWVNYGSFRQGVAALGGGDILLRAGRDIIDISASIPETIIVSGGKVAATPPTIKYYGGGDLIVRSGGDLTSGAFMVGRGNGDIRVGGTVKATDVNPVTGLPTSVGNNPVSLLLAIQDGYVDIVAGGPVLLAGILDPTSLAVLPVTGAAAAGAPFTSLGTTLLSGAGPKGSGVSISAVTGNVSIANPDIRTLFGAGSVNGLWPAALQLRALSGDVVLGDATRTGIPYPNLVPSADGGLQILAAGSFRLNGTLSMTDPLTISAQYLGSGVNGFNSAQYVSPLGVPLSNLTSPLHGADTDPSFIAAGVDIVGSAEVQMESNKVNLTLTEPSTIRAGRNIANFSLLGQNNAVTDITSVIAGQDLTGGVYALYGPGSFLLSAGRDMGTFLRSQVATSNISANYRGILAIGDGSNSAPGSNGAGNGFAVKPYLPRQSADIHLLFGVGPGVNYADAIDRYVDPAKAGRGGIDLLTGIAAALGEPRDQAWATFQTLPGARQQLLVQRAFVDFLGQVARDYHNAASPYHGQYQRAYDAIGVLFPASVGYPSERGSAASNSWKGELNIAQSLVQTQLGSDITILGPSGGIVAGSSARDLLKQNQQGIVTTAGGSIRVFTNDSIRINQSRIMTAQGGNIDVFVANGDIDAGSGPKTLLTSPVLSLICGVNGNCYINPNGLVTGAGVAALLTLPGQDRTKSNVTLAAPRGIIDLGAAGVRAGGDLVLAATRILNSYNAQSGGVVIGVPRAVSVDTGALTSASNATAATQQSAAPASAINDRPSVIIVEVLGYGGGDGGEPEPANDTYVIKKRQSYNASSPLQVTGLGN